LRITEESTVKLSKPTACPHCGHKLVEANRPIGPNVPGGPGSFAMCGECRGMLIFDEDCLPRVLTPEEKARLDFLYSRERLLLDTAIQIANQERARDSN
jgi:hypothetical protein